jgi:hypothetical protein
MVFPSAGPEFLDMFANFDGAQGIIPAPYDCALQEEYGALQRSVKDKRKDLEQLQDECRRLQHLRDSIVAKRQEWQTGINCL